MSNIVIASPYERNDKIEEKLRSSLSKVNILRVHNIKDLISLSLSEKSPQFIFFPHWSYIIPPEIYERFNCVIFHMTDLPYGRGGSPLQNLIVRGHKETKISALKCVKEIDGGPIYLKEHLSLEGTAEKILTEASDKIADMIIKIVNQNIQPVEQSGEITYFKRRLPSEGDLSNLETLHKVYDYIRMLDADGYPKAFLSTQDHIFEFSDVAWNQDGLEAKVCIKKKQL